MGSSQFSLDLHNAREPCGLALDPALALALPSGSKMKIKSKSMSKSMSRDRFMGSRLFLAEMRNGHESHVLCCGRDVRGPG
jgi:hypothetical protein